jgi:ubiquinone/menaquinone biosynthesis C-methylase UbiE
MLIQTILWICILLGILILFSKPKETFTSCDFCNAYGKEHVSVYDTLVYDGLRNKQELFFLDPILSNNSIVLDVGSGTGHHVHALQEKGIQAIGIDTSQSMIRVAQTKYSYDFLHGDALNTSMFSSGSFTHMLCMYYTIYYMKQKKLFFENASHWLMPGGYLAIHLSETFNYGPTSTFRGPFSYKSSHVHNTFHEIITKGKKRTRIEHKVYMESISSIIGIAKSYGFTVHSIYRYSIPYQGQFMYVFQKN